MRIVSWNIELGAAIDEAAEALVTRPELEGADVILVQEMSPSGTDRLAELLDLPASYRAAGSHAKTGDQFGNAILSPWPMADVEHLLLPHTAPIDGMARSAVFATLEIDGTPIRVGSLHLETVLLDLRRRTRQAATIGANLREWVEANQMPVVIGGDFNSASSRSQRAFTRALEPAGLERLSDGDAATFHRFSRAFTLDHLFGAGLDVIDSGVSEPSQASDHYPIWVEATVRDPA